MPDDRLDGVLIAGPTASGKSAFAVAIAARLQGAGRLPVIVNADSMQVYREMRVLSARPGIEDEAQIPHRLYGIVGAGEPFSVGHYLELARQVLAESVAEGAVPVIVGGTGLYFKALIQGLAEIPMVPLAVRQALRARHEGAGAQALFALLEARDPLTAARLKTRDRQRILRALEVLEATGRPLAAFQDDEPLDAPPLSGMQLQRFVMVPPRDWLRARIARRCAAMLREGAIEEARLMAGLGLAPEQPAMKAIGLAALCALVAGNLSQDEALSLMIHATNRYAKRQDTWFRNQMPDWRRMDPTDEKALEGVIAEMGS